MRRHARIEKEREIDIIVRNALLKIPVIYESIIHQKFGSNKNRKIKLEISDKYA